MVCAAATEKKIEKDKTKQTNRQQTYANRLHYSRLILFTMLYNLPSTRECTNRPLYEIREGTIADASSTV